MPTTSERLAQVSEQINSIPVDSLRIFSTGHQLAQAIEAKRFALILSVGQATPYTRGPSNNKPFCPTIDGVAPAFFLNNSVLVVEYDRLLALQHAFDNSREYQDIVKLVGPLQNQIIELEEQLEAENLERQKKRLRLLTPCAARR